MAANAEHPHRQRYLPPDNLLEGYVRNLRKIQQKLLRHSKV